jgi:FixJ family two-component response regulator
MVSDKSIIAVVDDEWSVRTMLGRVLRLAGYRVAAFSSGEDFMTSLATRLPECAIVDIHMSQMSGFDVQTRLLGAKRSVPVIFITASDDETLDVAARRLNVTRVLRKPFSSDELLAAVSAELASPPLGP